jgi:hypothetical protein
LTEQSRNTLHRLILALLANRRQLSPRAVVEHFLVYRYSHRFPFTLFLDAKNSSTESEYLVASFFSIPEVEGSKITYSQAKLVVRLPVQFEPFFLLQSAQASMETKRLTQSFVDLSRNVLSFILRNFSPDGSFQVDNKKSNKILIDLCPAVKAQRSLAILKAHSTMQANSR